MTDFGGGWSLEDCQYNCFKIDGCTDIIFAKDNGHCNTFAGCENAGEDSVWQHYKLQGTDLNNESKYSVLFSNGNIWLNLWFFYIFIEEEDKSSTGNNPPQTNPDASSNSGIFITLKHIFDKILFYQKIKQIWGFINFQNARLQLNMAHQ